MKESIRELVAGMRRALVAAAAGAFLLAVAAPASAQSVILGNGPDSVFEHNAVFMDALIGDAGGTAPLTVTVIVRHDPSRSLVGLAIDSNYDDTDDTATVPVTATTVEAAPGTSGLSRTTFTITLPNPLGFGNVNRRLDVPVRVAAVLDDDSRSASVTGLIDFFADDNPDALVDYPFLFGESQDATEVDPGVDVTFTFQGRDNDTGDANFTTFSAFAYRVRRLQDGAIVSGPIEVASCGDDCPNQIVVAFPAFGRFVVEAAAEQGNSPGDPNGVFSDPDSYFRIGAVDVKAECGTVDDGDAPDEAGFGLQFFVSCDEDDNDEGVMP